MYDWLLGLRVLTNLARPTYTEAGGSTAGFQSDIAVSIYVGGWRIVGPEHGNRGLPNMRGIV